MCHLHSDCRKEYTFANVALCQERSKAGDVLGLSELPRWGDWGDREANQSGWATARWQNVVPTWTASRWEGGWHDF